MSSYGYDSNEADIGTRGDPRNGDISIVYHIAHLTVARGYKAALNNPNVSDEAKQSLHQALAELGEGPTRSEQVSRKGKDPGNGNIFFNASILKLGSRPRS